MTDKNSNFVVAKSPDGSIQINFTIAFDLIDQARSKAVIDLAKDVEVPGFRKGNAPVEKAAEKLSKEKVLEKTLLSIIPDMLSKAIADEKLKPATYPKIELIKADENEPWEVRVTTCELPKIELPDYKKAIMEMGKSKIVTKSSDDKPKEMTRDEKINEVVMLLLNLVKVVVPQMLVEDEVNARLSSLLQRIEKLGLNLEGYLASVGKNPDSLRKEYEAEAGRAIALELILNEIAQKENVDVTPEKVEEALHATDEAHGHAHEHDPQQKQVVRSILRRSAVLDSLIALM